MLAKPALLCYTGYTSSERFFSFCSSGFLRGKHINKISQLFLPTHLKTPNHEEQHHLSLWLSGIHVEILVGAPPSWFFRRFNLGSWSNRSIRPFHRPQKSNPNLRFQKFRGRSRPNAPSNSLWIWRTCDNKDPLLTWPIGEVMAAAFES